MQLVNDCVFGYLPNLHIFYAETTTNWVYTNDPVYIVSGRKYKAINPILLYTKFIDARCVLFCYEYQMGKWKFVISLQIVTLFLMLKRGPLKTVPN